MTVSLVFIAVFAVTYSYTDRTRPEPPARVVDQATMDMTPATGGTVKTTDAQVSSSKPIGRDAARSSIRFTICHTGGGVNCVVDGDTAWISGVKVRIADIDAPETHPPRCDEEARLGARATERLAELMNMGPFDVVVNGRAEDRYGRQLRELMRNGRSLGGQLVSEGLARRWEGSRRPWC